MKNGHLLYLERSANSHVSLHADGQCDVSRRGLGNQADGVDEGGDVGKDLPVVEGKVSTGVGIDRGQTKHKNAVNENTVVVIQLGKAFLFPNKIAQKHAGSANSKAKIRYFLLLYHKSRFFLFFFKELLTLNNKQTKKHVFYRHLCDQKKCETTC